MNNIGRILWNLPASLRKLFRQLENNSKKLINKEWSYKFNEICLNEELWPTYTTNLIVENKEIFLNIMFWHEEVYYTNIVKKYKKIGVGQ